MNFVFENSLFIFGKKNMRQRRCLGFIKGDMSEVMIKENVECESFKDFEY